MADFYAYDQDWRGDWFGMRTFAASAVWNQFAAGDAMIMTNGYLYAMPFYCATGGTIQSLNTYLSAVNSPVRCTLGIYTAVSSANPYPGTLVIESASRGYISTVQLVAASMSQVLSSGQVYWFACMASSDGWGFLGFRAGGTRYDAGWWTDSAGDGLAAIAVTSWAYGAMPATFPSSFSRITSPRIAIMWT